MAERNLALPSLILGVLLAAGLCGGAWLIGDTVITAKQLERTVTVKGLAEREVAADQAIWPIRFSVGANELPQLTGELESATQRVLEFLQQKGFEDAEITLAAPSIVDKKAQGWGELGSDSFRYVASHTITVFTDRIDAVRSSRAQMIELSRQGVAIAADDYQNQVDYQFTGLNDLKPRMIEEATQAARQVAQKFATDSDSQLGKIRQANQGQFSIDDRDSNTPHIKRVRVVSTLEYYLVD
jgi:hypothetical protein